MSEVVGTGGGDVVATVECPFCCEQIPARAKKCRHCSETVDPAMRKAEEALRAVERQGNVYMNAATNTNVVAAPRRFPHLLHFILTILTLGWWAIVWIIHYLVSRDR
jgi:hypothetical protein